jgi:DNA-binding GntR family transcriptional regulator
MGMPQGGAEGNDAGAIDPASILSPTPAILLSDEVIDRLRDSILKGSLPTGYRLREEQLAEALGVSRGPVRNALLQLEREGLVVRRPNRGAIVAQLARQDLEEVYSLRLATEPLGCAWAARNVQEADLDEMQRVIDSYQKLLTSRVTEQVAAEADLRFHDAIYRASRHRRLIGLWHDLRPQVYVFLLTRRYVRARDFRTIMVENHGKILDAISRRDEDAAREAASAHVNASYARVLDAYEGDAASAASGAEDGGSPAR